jgi:ABC-type transporter Mla MlaB component
MHDAVPAIRLAFDGALTMRTAETLCTTLREAIGQQVDVSIDCTAAGEVDLTFVQLLVAARASARRSGRTVTLAAQPEGTWLHTLTRAGFRITHEDRPGEARAYWFEGAEA